MIKNIKENYFNFQVKTGANVASKKDQNSKDWVISDGNISEGNKTPTKILFEKSGAGNKSKPKNNPNIIEIKEVFSLIFLL